MKMGLQHACDDHRALLMLGGFHLWPVALADARCFLHNRVFAGSVNESVTVLGALRNGVNLCYN